MTDNEALYHFNKYCESCRNNAAMAGVKEEDILCDKCKVKNALDALEGNITVERLKELATKLGYKVLKKSEDSNCALTIEAEPAKHGHWIWDKCANMGGAPKCSVCGRRSHSGAWAGENNYCPRCGAKMEDKK